jgi:hypothetical protein
MSERDELALAYRILAAHGLVDRRRVSTYTARRYIMSDCWQEGAANR